MIYVAFYTLDYSCNQKEFTRIIIIIGEYFYIVGEQNPEIAQEIEREVHAWCPEPRVLFD